MQRVEYTRNATTIVRIVSSLTGAESSLWVDRFPSTCPVILLVFVVLSDLVALDDLMEIESENEIIPRL